MITNVVYKTPEKSCSNCHYGFEFTLEFYNCLNTNLSGKEITDAITTCIYWEESYE